MLLSPSQIQENHQECWGENWVYPLKVAYFVSYFHFKQLFNFPVDVYESWHWLGTNLHLSLLNSGCVPRANSRLTPRSCFPVSLSFPDSLREHWFQQCRKWNCVALRLPAGEGDMGRVRGRGSLRKRTPLQFFFFFLNTESLRMWVRSGLDPEKRRQRGLRTILRWENIFTETFEWQWA